MVRTGRAVDRGHRGWRTAIVCDRSVRYSWLRCARWGGACGYACCGVPAFVSPSTCEALQQRPGGSDHCALVAGARRCANAHVLQFWGVWLASFDERMRFWTCCINKVSLEAIPLWQLLVSLCFDACLRFCSCRYLRCACTNASKFQADIHAQSCSCR